MERKKIIQGIITIILILVILLCTTDTVMSKEKISACNRRKYYAAMEKEYLSGVEQLLDERGYSNSGITLRWVTDEEGMRTYTVMIHHRKISRLDSLEREELQRKLTEAEFSDANCEFNYEF